jgi:hypothetical protein
MDMSPCRRVLTFFTMQVTSRLLGIPKEETASTSMGNTVAQGEKSGGAAATRMASAIFTNNTERLGSRCAYTLQRRMHTKTQYPLSRAHKAVPRSHQTESARCTIQNSMYVARCVGPLKVRKYIYIHLSAHTVILTDETGYGTDQTTNLSRR